MNNAGPVGNEQVLDRAGKLPPQNIEAEQSVLGSMLIEDGAITRAIEILKPEDFYLGAHRRIFESICALYDAGHPVDIVTVTEELKKSKNLKSVGNASYLQTLIDGVSTAANIAAYANIVRDKALLRKLLDVSTRIIERAYSGAEDSRTLLDETQQEILRIAGQKEMIGFKPIKDLVPGAISTIESIYKREKGFFGLPTGFRKLDDMLGGGFHTSNLIIIAGRPSMGKTALGLNIAQHAALVHKVPAAIFSLEMSGEALVERLLSAEARVDLHAMRRGVLRREAWPKLTNAAARLHDAELFIDDSPNLSVLEMKARARRLQTELKKSLGLIVVDYLQRMPGRSGRVEYRQQEVAEISRSLKDMAMELKIPVVAISQLSRAIEQRGVPRPRLSDLRESGAIEQDADVVMFVYRSEVYDINEQEETGGGGTAEIIIGKQRNGPIGVVKLAFVKEYAKFENLETSTTE